MINVNFELEKLNPQAANLLRRYDKHRRVLPWRAKQGAYADPYAVWLSEIMLQQTTVTAVKPYFEKFLARWPKVENLANAPVEEVMQQWAGLGYYSRARNLHLCAKHVVTEFGGVFPANEQALLKLPGIGPYTAAAIASIAFDIRAVVVDGNVERVITRLYAIETPLPAAKITIKAYANTLTPHARTGDFAQAMMDLGATICTPRRPNCDLCPFFESCAARISGLQETYPVKAPKKIRPVRYGAAFILHRHDGAVLVRRRAPKGLLGGMVEVPTTDWSSNVKADLYESARALEAAPIDADWGKIGVANHVFTHFTLILDVYRAYIAHDIELPEHTYWAEAHELEDEAFPSLFRKVLAVDLKIIL
jgi:A/G-specific adenine glycosylase